MTKRSESRMALYLPMCRNEFRRLLAFGGSISNIAPRLYHNGGRRHAHRLLLSATGEWVVSARGCGVLDGLREPGGGSVSNSGLGATAGLGYDVRIAANTSITPVFNYVWGHPDRGFNQSILQFAVGVTFH